MSTYQEVLAYLEHFTNAEPQPDSPQAEAFMAMARNVAGAVSTQVLKAPRLPVIGSQPRA